MKLDEQKVIEMMQAHLNGEVIQYSTNGEDWAVCPEAYLWHFNEFQYRIKPIPIQRPYTFDELKKAIIKHNNLIITNDGSIVGQITRFTENNVYSTVIITETYEDLFKHCKWLDDRSQCGFIDV